MLIIIFLFFHSASSQILKDPTTLDLIREDVNLIYNFRFDSARICYDKIVNLYSNHPIANILKGIMIYWEDYPLLPNSSAHESFVEEMTKAIELSESVKDPELEAEYLLANLCARGMLLMFYSDNDMTSEIIPLTVRTYTHVRKSFDYTDYCPDLYYFTGLYNYYREAYPDMYPVYKSLALLFPKGSKAKGLDDLKKCSESSFLLSPEASYLLSWIYLNFENDYEKALVRNNILMAEYPQNYMYKAFMIKNLLLMKRYNEAEKLLPAVPEETENRFFKGQVYVFKGIIEEKKYRNTGLAFQNYRKGVEIISLTGTYGSEYLSYGYAGLSRISEQKGEKQAAKIYHEKARKLAEFKKVNFDR
jgi:hypothetical protein